MDWSDPLASGLRGVQKVSNQQTEKGGNPNTRRRRTRRISLSLSLSVFPRGEQRVGARAPNENSKQQQL